MNKTLIVYSSVTGYTAKYAEWIKEEISCDIVPYKKLSKVHMEKYDLVIFGGRVHTSFINNLKSFKRKLKKSHIKNLIIYACGITPLSETKALNDMWKNNLKPDELESIPHFFLEGGLNIEKLAAFDRMLIKLFIKAVEKKKEKNISEITMLDILNGEKSNFKKDNIKELVNFIKEHY